MKIEQGADLHQKRKSKWLLRVFFLILFSAVVVLLFKIVVFRDYLLKMQVTCDPSHETCFVHVCDPSFEKCSGQLDQDTLYYKFVEKSAVLMPQCNQREEGCAEPSCEKNENQCTETLCTDETVEVAAGDTCNDPATYNAMQIEGAEGITE
ncbi:MAG: hypothetical protein KBD65_01090 [Candidatus Moranbacteria bacterium]|nr:hypothetical protein [Candidatus Moranbacteria bacterium]